MHDTFEVVVQPDSGNCFEREANKGLESAASSLWTAACAGDLEAINALSSANSIVVTDLLLAQVGSSVWQWSKTVWRRLLLQQKLKIACSDKQHLGVLLCKLISLTHNRFSDASRQEPSTSAATGNWKRIVHAVVNELIAAGADVNAVTEHIPGVFLSVDLPPCPLLLAADLNASKLVDCLLSAGATAVDPAIDFAFRHENWAIAEMLVDHGANKAAALSALEDKFRNRVTKTGLYMHLSRTDEHCVEGVRLLSKLGVDPNDGQDKFKNSGLHWAIISGWEKDKRNRATGVASTQLANLTNAMLSCGANPNVNNKAQQTALEKLVDFCTPQPWSPAYDLSNLRSAACTVSNLLNAGTAVTDPFALLLVACLAHDEDLVAIVASLSRDHLSSCVTIDMLEKAAMKCLKLKALTLLFSLAPTPAHVTTVSYQHAFLVALSERDYLNAEKLAAKGAIYIRDMLATKIPNNDYAYRIFTPRWSSEQQLLLWALGGPIQHRDVEFARWLLRQSYPHTVPRDDVTGHKIARLVLTAVLEDTMKCISKTRSNLAKDAIGALSADKKSILAPQQQSEQLAQLHRATEMVEVLAEAGIPFDVGLPWITKQAKLFGVPWFVDWYTTATSPWMPRSHAACPPVFREAMRSLLMSACMRGYRVHAAEQLSDARLLPPAVVEEIIFFCAKRMYCWLPALCA